MKSRVLPGRGNSGNEAGEAEGAILPGWKINSLDYPTFRLTLIAKIMDRLTIRYLAARGDITYAEWRVLARLATMPAGGTVGQIAELAWVDRAEVSRAAASLEAKGFAGRHSNEKDRRTPIIFLTLPGRDLYAVAIRERAQFHKTLLVGLSPDECDQLDVLLERIGERLLQLLSSSTDIITGNVSPDEG